MSQPDVPLPDYDLSYDLYWHTQGMDAENKARMKRAELGEAERARWAELGVGCPKIAWGWKARGIAPEEAARWHTAGVSPKEYDTFLEAGCPLDALPLSVDERREARRQGLALDQAFFFKRDGGFDVATAAAWALQPFQPNPSIARAWKEQGFTPEAASGWSRAGVSDAEQAKAWERAGFDPESCDPWRRSSYAPEVAQQLLELGLAPDDDEARRLRFELPAWRALAPLDEALAWVLAGFRTPREVRPWREAGFEPDEAASWANRAGEPGVIGFDCARASRWRAHGVEVPEARALRREGLQASALGPWLELGFQPQQVGRAKRAFTLPDAAKLLELGLDAEAVLAWAASPVMGQARDWVAAGVTRPVAAEAWRAAGVQPGEAGPWAAAGLAPEDAQAWRRVCRDPLQAAAAIDLGLTPDQWAARTATEPKQARSASGQRLLLFWGLPFPRSQDRDPWGGEPGAGRWPETWRRRYVVRSGGGDPQESGCTLGRYGTCGSREYCFPYAAIASSQVEVDGWGTFTPPTVEGDWPERMRAFCEVLGLTWSEPSWHVAAFWES